MSRRIEVKGSVSIEKWGDAFRRIVAQLRPPLARAVVIELKIRFTTDLTDQQSPMRALRENARQMGFSIGDTPAVVQANGVLLCQVCGHQNHGPLGHGGDYCDTCTRESGPCRPGGASERHKAILKLDAS